MNYKNISFLVLISFAIGLFGCTQAENTAAPAPTITVTVSPKQEEVRTEYSRFYPSEDFLRQILIEPYYDYVGRMPTENEFLLYRDAVYREALENPTEIRIQGSSTEVMEGFNQTLLYEFTESYVLNTPEAREWAQNEGFQDTVSNVFEKMAEDARKEVEGVTRPGNQ